MTLPSTILLRHQLFPFVLVCLLVITLSSHAETVTSPEAATPKATSPKARPKATTIRLGTLSSAKPFFGSQPNVALHVIKSALKQQGLELQLMYLPRMRSLAQANQGYLDGDLLRSPGAANRADNLIPVPTPVCYMNYYLYAPIHKTTSNYWKDFANPRPVFLSDMYDINNIWVDVNLPPPIAVADTKQAIRAIERGSANVMLLPNGLLEMLMRNSGSLKYLKLHPPVGKTDLFLLLHKRHTALIDPIANNIKETKQVLHKSGKVRNKHFVCGTTFTP